MPESDDASDWSELERKLEELHPYSFGWTLGRCGWNKEEAEEVLQMTYVKILEGRAIYRGKSSLKTWLFAVIRKTAAEYQRRKFFRNLGLVRFLQSRPEAEPSTEAAENQLRERVLEVLKSLPVRQREVLELVFYQDLTIEQAAEVMDVSIGTARTHYKRAKEQMRNKMKTAENL
ncbi:RNA polymerase sigma factor [bacterium]|nr:RNA polymerase sigma factor [bacterium]